MIPIPPPSRPAIKTVQVPAWVDTRKAVPASLATLHQSRHHPPGDPFAPVAALPNPFAVRRTVPSVRPGHNFRRRELWRGHATRLFPQQFELPHDDLRLHQKFRITSSRTAPRFAPLAFTLRSAMTSSTR